MSALCACRRKKRWTRGRHSQNHNSCTPTNPDCMAHSGRTASSTEKQTTLAGHHKSRSIWKVLCSIRKASLQAVPSTEATPFGTRQCERQSFALGMKSISLYRWNSRVLSNWQGLLQCQPCYKLTTWMNCKFGFEENRQFTRKDHPARIAHFQVR